MKKILPANPETCPRCYVGRIKQKRITLSAAVSSHLLTVPNFPAWQCDVCHAFMYDPKALRELNGMLAAPGSKLRRRPAPKSAQAKKNLTKTAKDSASF
ncbi:MAG: YgiT-type zinc finger protein [Anaerolineaceae bacterium]|nr:YgiT-type zinc finger protein [Anaerolineaceae bacterium]